MLSYDMGMGRYGMVWLGWHDLVEEWDGSGRDRGRKPGERDAYELIANCPAFMGKQIHAFSSVFQPGH